ncbi:MAG: hypothetical protein U5K79_02060 [Cyclobacteriaceae bacterium]|nr:hypothetical protein [Cyclobacteriaceae bacterium]
MTDGGVYYGKDQNPELTGIRNPIGDELGVYSTSLRDLESSTTYFVKAYATNLAGTAFGEQISFSTKDGNNCIVIVSSIQEMTCI